MKRPAASWPPVAAAAAVLVGVAGPHAQVYARWGLVGLAVLLAVTVVAANPGKILGGIAAFVFLTDARMDWRPLVRAVLVIGGVAVVAFLPDRWWLLLTVAGGAALVGMAARRWVRLPATRWRSLPAPTIGVPDWWSAVAFRLRYRNVAAELGWDKDRTGKRRDRRSIPGLAESRLRDGVWTVVLVSRGDWGPDRWEKEAWALARFLDGRSVRWRMDGLRVVLTVHTRALPTPGEITVTEPPRATEAGLLVGHDAARRPVHWAADDTAPHLLAVGSTGGGKSTLASLLLVQAAVTDGWEAVLLDCKETRAWEWLRAWGVTVIRRRSEIHPYLRGLEAHRQQVEDAGGTTTRRLVVIDEARLVLGTHPGDDREQRRETIGVVGDLTSLGRSAGIRLAALIQRPDVEHVGGGFLRDNLPARVALGRLEPDGVGMVFGGRTTSPDEVACLDGTPGRALVSGLRGGDSDVHPIQVPRLHLPRRTVPAPQPSAAPSLRDRVLGEVPDGGVVERAVVCRRLGVDPRSASVRRAVDDLVAAGRVVVGRDGRGRVVLARGAGPGAAGVPLPTVTASSSPPARHTDRLTLPGVEAA